VNRTEQRRRAGRLGGLVTASRHDPADYTRAARQGWLDRFLSQTDPKLPLHERERRARALLRLYMARLSARSAKVRAGRKGEQ
jgi:hypothetical protein